MGFGLSISDIVKRKRIRSRAGWGEALQAGREVRLREALCLSFDPSGNQSWVWSLTAQIPGCV